MSLESFFGFEAGEGMSEGALEALREKMAAAAAQIAAIKKEESKQKKTEEELDFVLLDWKGLGNSEQRQRVISILDRLYLNYRKTSDISK